MTEMLQDRSRSPLRGLLTFFFALVASLLAMGLVVFALTTLCWPLARYMLRAEPSFLQVAAGVLAFQIAQSPVFILIASRLPKPERNGL